MNKALLFIAAGWLLGSCTNPDDHFVEQRYLAMGTWVDITHASIGADLDAALERSIETYLRAFETDYYAWADGELAAINAQLDNGQRATASPDMQALLGLAQRLSAASGGSFDPGIGSLVELWGFHSSTAAASSPSTETVERWLAARPSIADLVIDKDFLWAARPGLKIDLGGIAKGAAVDRMLAMMSAAGVRDALVDAGGDLRAVGTHGDRAWRVGIQAPRGAGVLGIIELADGEAAFTSGDYERFRDENGHRMHHLLDPLTGQPAEHTQAVTVITHDGALADAAATAIFVAGPERWREVAAALDVALVLRVDSEGAVSMTDGMRARLTAASGDTLKAGRS
jgi:thiamine biosynthesis lipoprotein